MNEGDDLINDDHRGATDVKGNFSLCACDDSAHELSWRWAEAGEADREGRNTSNKL